MPASHAAEPVSRRFRVTMTVALAIWWCTTLLLIHEFDVGQGSSEVEQNVRAQVAANATEEGSLSRQLVVVLWALLGLANYPRLARALGRSRRFRRSLTRLAIPVALYGAWAMLSIAWSVSPELSFRRLAAFALVVMGAVGLGAGFYGSVDGGGRTLALHLVGAGVIVVGFLWLPALVRGDVALTDASWALLSPAVGSPAANPLAVGALAASYLAVRGRPGRNGPRAISWHWLAAVAFFLFTIFALRKRVSLTLALLLVGVFLFVLVYRHRAARNVLVLSVAAGVLLLASLETAGLPLTEASLPFATRGLSAENAASLNGRIPLWQSLLPFVGDRPLHGHGYGAFWNADRLPEVQAEVGWPAVVGHNGFLDETLATGLVGAVLIVAAFIWGLASVGHLGPGQRRAGLLVAFVVVLFLLSNVTESILQTTFNYQSYVALLGLFALAAWSPRAARSAAPRRPDTQ